MKRSGYLVTLFGAGLGGFFLAWGLGALGAWIEVEFYAGPYDGFAGIMGAVIGGTVGAAVGSGLGAWLGLRWRKHRRAGATAGVLAIVAPASQWAALLSGAGAIMPMAFIGTVVAVRAVVLALPADPWAERP